MKLQQAHVSHFRSILDSGTIKIDQSTCLVGKNEAGKTAFLKALEGLNSTDEHYKSYDKIESYPRRFLAEYDELHPDEDARVLETKWSLEPDDVAAVEDILGRGTVSSKVIEVSKLFEQTTRNWVVKVDHKAVLDALKLRFDLSDEESAPLRNGTTTRSAHSAIEALDEPSAAQSELKAVIETFRDKCATLAAIDVLKERMPAFLYFSHYDRMNGAISIAKLAADEAQPKGISEEDRVFLDFLLYAGTTLEELKSANEFEVLNAKCEAAANRITEQIFEYWTQNQDLEIQVVFSEGKPGDPPPFNSGPVARARVRNNLHKVTVPFSERSAGFVWFFSFLVKFSQIRKEQSDIILLLDEPGLTLHGTAQHDLLRYFAEKLEPDHQIIYSTHSPFMVPPDRFDTVRTVEDVVRTDERGRRVSDGTKIRDDALSTDPQTNFPLFGAMGFEVTQSLFIAPNTLLVEGPGDILYLQAAASILKKLGRQSLEQRWAICPSGGIDKIAPFIKLFSGNKLNIVVLTDFDRGQKKKIEKLRRSQLLEDGRIILANEIAEKEEADIEDFFEPSIFCQLINETYSLKGEHKLTVKKLNEADESTGRLVKKAEAYFRLLPDTIPMFSHYDPALYLLQHPELLAGETAAIQKTLERFEAVFTRIAMYQ